MVLSDATQLKIEQMAKRVRKKILDMSYQAGGGSHLGGGLSMVEIMTTLFSSVMNIDLKKPDSINRDRFILSKGHGVLGFFPVLTEVGLMTNEMLSTYKQNEDLINVGAYVKNSNPKIDEAINKFGPISSFLKQPYDQLYPRHESFNALKSISA